MGKSDATGKTTKSAAKAGKKYAFLLMLLQKCKTPPKPPNQQQKLPLTLAVYSPFRNTTIQHSKHTFENSLSHYLQCGQPYSKIVAQFNNVIDPMSTAPLIFPWYHVAVTKAK